MDEAYNYRAPQYVDFASAVHDNEDNDFFDYDMDTGAPLSKEFSPDAPPFVNEPATPYKDAENDDDDDASSTHSAESRKSRRLTSHRRSTFHCRSVFDGIEVETPMKKKHSMKTRLDSVTRTPRLELRSRSIVKAIEDSPLGVQSPLIEAQSPHDVPMLVDEEVHHSSLNEVHNIPKKNAGKRPVPAPRKRKLAETTHGAYQQPPSKFISMAEHIIKIQKQTPARFRTKPRFDGVTKKTFGGPTAPKTITVPHTPALVSHLRTRPVHALTREEEELKEFEEAQKTKFKAMPLKENHFKSTRVAVVERKPPTQVEPFHLTEYRPKLRAPDEPPVVFKARPVPKAVRSGPKVEVPQKKKKMPTPPPKAAPKSHPGPLRTRTTVVKPFSFENRGFDPKAKREKLLKEMEEQERKAKEFKARPLPCKIKAVVETIPKVQRSKPVEEEAPVEKFKARSPAVLRKAPFIPAKSARAPLEPKPFNLHSEVRMQERQKYDLILKQKELEQEEEKRRQQEEEARRTAEEVAELRRQTVHHAKPVPHFRRFEVKPSHAPLTNPHSPNFMKRLRSQKTAATEKLNTTFDIENP